MLKDNKIEIYKTPLKKIEIEISLDKGTVWLNLNKIAELFETSKQSISYHLQNIFQEKELDKNPTVKKILTVQTEGKRKVQREIEYFNLDVIISVGYRINSKKATQFRIWATDVLKRYLNGYAINDKKLLTVKRKFLELKEIISFLENKSKKVLLDS